MRYLMQHKLFSIGRDYTIKDETGQDRFFVDGKVFTLGHRLVFQDMAGNEVLTIQQQLLHFRPTYEITRAGAEVAEVTKQFTFFAERFTVDIPGPDDLEAQGDFWNHEYAFVRQGREVAHVSERWFSVTDTYGVDIAPGEDDALILACTVVIDMVNEDRERASH
jgi:uncharacterized protein YxjI